MLNRNNVIVVLLFVLLLIQQGTIEIPAIPWPQEVDRVTYVYDVSDGAVPPPIAYALRELNKKDIIATPFEVDTTDSDQEVPDQDAIAVAAAKEHGLPAMVVQAGDRVTRIVKSPKTVQDVSDGVGILIGEPE